MVAGAFEWESANFAAAGPAARHGSQSTVMIAPGTGIQGVSHVLASAGVVVRPELFQLGVLLRRAGNRLKAGEYAIPSRASMLDIMDILIAGKSLEHKFTAAEGLTSDMIYQLVKADPGLAGNPGPEPEEGSLLPETYLYTHGATRSALLQRMHDAQLKYLDAVWSKRNPSVPLKSPAEALILASIVEKETSLPEERRHIAAVFERRLQIGMKLQSDPTIIYGLTKGYPLGRPIRASEISAATPYNTYVVSALPASPICNPGKDSIDAVLNPVESDDLYFVANGNGGHLFARSEAQQDRNVAAWRRFEAQHH
ncbi:MAG: endolytic transglycosylase MltG [Alphaproteobacteria bacterium]|nr:endolytic transglycosylase MltG [Alphaproteobacteria bacterium]